MDGKTLTKVGVITVALAGAGFFAYSNLRDMGEGDEYTTRKMSYLCGNPQCQNEFVLTMKEVRASVKETGGVVCPKCNKALGISAYQCPSCHRMNLPVGHGGTPKNCQYCKAPLPKDLE